MTRTGKQAPRWQEGKAKYLRQPCAHRVIDGRKVWIRGWYAHLTTSYLRRCYTDALVQNKRDANETLPQYMMRNGMLERNVAA